MIGFIYIYIYIREYDENLLNIFLVCCSKPSLDLGPDCTGVGDGSGALVLIYVAM